MFDLNGITPVVANSSQNNGIGGYTNKKPTEDGGIITFSDTTTSDSIFYQSSPFVGYPHVQGLYPLKNKDIWTEILPRTIELQNYRDNLWCKCW